MKYNTLPFVLVGILFLLSCDAGKKTLSSLTGEVVRPQMGVLVLVDGSGSTKPFEGDYRAAFNNLVRSLPPNTRLVAGRISGITEASFQPAINDTTPPPSGPLVSYPQADSIRTRYSRKLATKLDDLFTDSLNATSTDLLSSLSLMQTVFPRDSSFKSILVIFSDMIHETSELDLTRENLDPTSIPRIVDQLVKKGLIPNLQGASVYAIGAYSTDPEKYRQIKLFWEEVFDRSKVTVKQYGHSTAQFTWD